MTEQLMILIAGPYCGGTGDDMVATGQRLARRHFRDLTEVPDRRR